MQHPLNLPVILLAEVLTIWLDLSSLLALDSASCSGLSRKAYLDVVGSLYLDRAPLPADQQNSAMEWFTSRQVKASRLSIDCSFDLDLRTFSAFLRESGTRLQSLRINNSSEPLELREILRMVSCASLALRTLSIEDCGVIDAKSLSALLSKSSQTLMCLEIGECELSAPLSATSLPDLMVLHLRSAFIAIGDICKLISASPSLRSFLCDDLHGSDDCLEALAAHCPLLQVLSYERGDISGVSSLVQLLQSCPLIEVVDFSSDANDENHSATDAHIAAVMQHCGNLKAFSSPGSSISVTDASILAVASRVHNLRHLCLDGCTFRSAAPILALAEHCGDLMTLDLWAHKGESFDLQAALVALVSNLRSIEELNLDHCHISDAVLEAIAAHCPHLQRLHLFESTGYSDAGIAAVALGCTALKEVYVGTDAVFAPLGRRLWSALRPGIQFTSEGLQSRVWEALLDIEREKLVVW